MKTLKPNRFENQKVIDIVITTDFVTTVVANQSHHPKSKMAMNIHGKI